MITEDGGGLGGCVPNPKSLTRPRAAPAEHRVDGPALSRRQAFQSGSSKPRLTGSACHPGAPCSVAPGKRDYPRDGPPTRPGVVTGASSHGHAALCAVTPPRGARTHGSAELRGVALVHANAQISPWVGGGLQIRTGSVALWVLVAGRRGGARPRALAGSHRHCHSDACSAEDV